MRFLVIFGVLFVTVSSIVFDDDSSSGSHEYSGGRGGNHGHNGNHGNHGNHEGRPPRPNRPPVTRRPTRCETGWTRANRQSGGWCVKVFAGMTNQPQAESFCAQHGARLSAVESHEERETIAELGRVVMTTTSAWKFGTLRTGVVRDSNNSPFHSTDGNAKDLNAVRWSGGEPINGLNRDNDCGMMWLWVPGGRRGDQRQHGLFFSMVCYISWNDRFRGYVCGKRAQ
ncbi:hypothetical protein B9Z55_010159 [Caenorhabditis nigoni]|uniref:C-type lectin domain-containing protein n=1 Tax=Caenorhabditis nigoni TaxID=1611254 RepID=A0A2G5UF87_9PELO|nr:hypothetical protein B9Z55_010159 [Caenorhabditis nigoni]